MLTRQREREQEYMALHQLKSGKSFWGRKGNVKEHHQVILDGFVQEKTRIKQNIRDVKKQ